MGIGVEQPFHHEAVEQHRAHVPPDQLPLLGREGVDVHLPDRHAGGLAHDEDLFGDVEHVGHAEVLEVLEHLPELLHVRRLDGEVDLGPHGREHDLEHRLGLEDLRDRRRPLHGQLHRLGQDLHVEAGGGGDAGPLHLEDDLLPVGLHRPVDLGDRRRPERHVGVDLGEPVPPVEPEVLLEDGLELGERAHHDLLVEVLEGVDHRLGHEVGPGREHLPDLDVEGAEVLQRVADGPGPFPLVVLRVGEPVAAPLPPQSRLAGQQLSEDGGHLQDPFPLPHR